MFVTLRHVLHAALLHAAIAYAVVLTLYRRTLTPSSPTGPTKASLPSQATVTVDELKLWICLGTVYLTTVVEVDAIPLFAEVRIIAIYMLLLGPPQLAVHAYDSLVAPLLGTLRQLSTRTAFRSGERRLSFMACGACATLSRYCAMWAHHCGALDARQAHAIDAKLVEALREMNRPHDKRLHTPMSMTRGAHHGVEAPSRSLPSVLPPPSWATPSAAPSASHVDAYATLSDRKMVPTPPQRPPPYPPTLSSTPPPSSAPLEQQGPRPMLSPPKPGLMRGAISHLLGGLRPSQPPPHEKMS